MASKSFSLGNFGLDLDVGKQASLFAQKFVSVPQIKVLSGMHRGAVAQLSLQRVRIGEGYDNDIVLMGDGLAQKHAELKFLAPLWRQVEITALEGGVRADSATIAPGQSLIVKLPARLGLAQAEFELIPGELSEGARSNIPTYAFIGVFLLGLLFFGKSWFEGIGNIGSFGKKAPSSAALIAAGNKRVDDMASALSGLQAQLLENKIDQVQLQSTKSGLIASGNVDESDLPKWRSVLQWYDAQGFSTTLANQVVGDLPKPELPPIRSVWLDDPPHVVWGTGRSAGLGETIGDGWIIDEIDATSVVIKRDGRSVRLKL